MSVKNNKYKRSQFIINPQFQYKLIGIFVGFSLLMSVAIIGFLSFSYKDFRTKLNQMETQLSLYTDLVNTFIEEDHVVFWVPKEVQRNIIIQLTALVITLALLIIGFGFYISHRIAGPLYRLNFCLLSLAENKPVPHLRFRDKDEFQNLADSFNKGVGELTGKINELQKKNQEIVTRLEDLSKSERPGKDDLLKLISDYR